MPDNIIEVVNQIGEDDGSPNGLFLCNTLKESTIDDIYGDVEDNSSCASNKSWDMKKDNGQEDQKNIVYDDAVDNEEINNLNGDGLHLRNDLGDNVNDGNNEYSYIKQGGVVNGQDEQGNHFSGANNNPQAQNTYFGGANELDQKNSLTNMTTTATTMITTITKVKIKSGTITTIQKYQTTMDHIMILTSMMEIQMIANNKIMIPQATGITNSMLRNLKMIMIVIRMILIKMKEMLLYKEEITTWLLEE